ncbi:MAG: DUF21 domain-containing protein [Planctomycetaceae bacterium]|nr:DUF21 domain-containing protein [Planctomycetaceae bacterium]
MSWFEPIFVLLLFAIGLRLSAFFSGSETGFYRVSFPRLSIDAQAGDRVAKRLMWFARKPAYFVATTLVGNNLANFLTTFAISWGVVVLFGQVTNVTEIASTMLMSPVVFLFGELLPKNLYYRAPLSLLRRDSTLFMAAYYLLMPASWPLVGVTKLIERLYPEGGRRTELFLGRSRLVQLMTQGRHEGLLTDVQNRLANGVLQTAPLPVTDSMTPCDRVLGVSEESSREEILKFARRYATPLVALHRASAAEDWFAYIRVLDVLTDTGPLRSLFRPMPILSPSASKLDALQQLQIDGELYGVVKEGETVRGVVNSRGLCEQLFRPATPTGDLAL